MPHLRLRPARPLRAADEPAQGRVRGHEEREPQGRLRPRRAGGARHRAGRRPARRSCRAATCSPTSATRSRPSPPRAATAGRSSSQADARFSATMPVDRTESQVPFQWSTTGTIDQWVSTLGPDDDPDTTLSVQWATVATPDGRERRRVDDVARRSPGPSRSAGRSTSTEETSFQGYPALLVQRRPGCVHANGDAATVRALFVRRREQQFVIVVELGLQGPPAVRPPGQRLHPALGGRPAGLGAGRRATTARSRPVRSGRTSASAKPCASAMAATSSACGRRQLDDERAARGEPPRRLGHQHPQVVEPVGAGEQRARRLPVADHRRQVVAGRRRRAGWRRPRRPHRRARRAGRRTTPPRRCAPGWRPGRDRPCWRGRRRARRPMRR